MVVLKLLWKNDFEKIMLSQTRESYIYCQVTLFSDFITLGELQAKKRIMKWLYTYVRL